MVKHDAIFELRRRLPYRILLLPSCAVQILPGSWKQGPSTSGYGKITQVYSSRLERARRVSYAGIFVRSNLTERVFDYNRSVSWIPRVEAIGDQWELLVPLRFATWPYASQKRRFSHGSWNPTPSFPCIWSIYCGVRFHVTLHLVKRHSHRTLRACTFGWWARTGGCQCIIIRRIHCTLSCIFMTGKSH